MVGPDGALPLPWLAEPLRQALSTLKSLLEAPQWIGVESVAGDAVTIRITARTTPTQQVQVAREIRERLKVAFDAAGIVVPTIRRP